MEGTVASLIFGEGPGIDEVRPRIWEIIRLSAEIPRLRLTSPGSTSVLRAATALDESVYN